MRLNVQLILASQRIVGGTATTIEKYPFHASVRTVNNFHFCGGNIISDVSVCRKKLQFDFCYSNGIILAVGFECCSLHNLSK